jgi:hypothetical protein
MFPVTNRAEMRADADNELARIPDGDFRGIWSAVMTRLRAVPEYRAMFAAAYPGQSVDEMTFAHASNAIGGFLVDKVTFAEFLAKARDVESQCPQPRLGRLTVPGVLHQPIRGDHLAGMDRHQGEEGASQGGPRGMRAGAIDDIYGT